MRARLWIKRRCQTGDQAPGGRSLQAGAFWARGLAIGWSQFVRHAKDWRRLLVPSAPHADKKTPARGRTGGAVGTGKLRRNEFAVIITAATAAATRKIRQFAEVSGNTLVPNSPLRENLAQGRSPLGRSSIDGACGINHVRPRETI